MADKMFCPFCGEPLEKHYYEYENSYGERDYGDNGLLVCENAICQMYNRLFEPDIWTIFDNGVKAITALKTIADKNYYNQDGNEAFVAPVPTLLKLISVIDLAQGTLNNIKNNQNTGAIDGQNQI